ncbi:hypothetical protein N7468_006805 [Penicillium chermesinum]|uniref:Uncharacterized protein n=1 Tax=Penicillium chermesinum TaxID=63820 RepID=A0A9W9NT21_9EURO|nr:uncharacterized protein N7468_006805 [Penicillium chermesinum]KAJ5225580.1 hypothetical protein N7468_006805 [Penicillium chermesinum]
MSWQFKLASTLRASPKTRVTQPQRVFPILLCPGKSAGFSACLAFHFDQQLVCDWPVTGRSCRPFLSVPAKIFTPAVFPLKPSPVANLISLTLQGFIQRPK